MVDLLLCHAAFLLAETTSIPVKLPEPLRTTVLMALLGILLVGLLLIAGTLLGGHWVRRLGGHRRGPVVPKDYFPHLEKRKLTKKQSARSQADPQSGKDTIATDDTTVS